MSINLIATCPESTKEIVADELSELGAINIRLGYMAVYFDASEKDFYRIHLKCATASQLMIMQREAAASNSNILYSQAKRINWPAIFTNKKTFRIDVNASSSDSSRSGKGQHTSRSSSKSTSPREGRRDRGSSSPHSKPSAMNSDEVTRIVRASVEHVFEVKGQAVPKVDLKNPDVVIAAYLHAGRITISVVTSGMTLHKRGYKIEGHPAPLKETLAATLLRIAEYDGVEALLDPMAGSGTIGIEACNIALHKGCNIHRKKGVFSFENLCMFDSQLWRKIQDEVRLEKLDEIPGQIYVSDIEESYVDLAKSNALRARVEKHMTFSTRSFFDMEKPAETGLILCNLPYGTRIEGSKGEGQVSDMGELYKSVGDSLKKNFHGWRAALLCAADTPWKAIGLKPSEKYDLLNGSIKTKFLIYSIRQGSFRG